MLTKNWAITPTFDRELKHYQLLGYIQRVEQHFEQYRLYPYLSELREDHSELLELRKRKEELQRTVRGVLTGFDVRAGEALHEALPLPGPFDVIEDLLDKAIPRLAHVLEHGIQLQHELLGVVRGGAAHAAPFPNLPSNGRARESLPSHVFSALPSPLEDTSFPLRDQSIFPFLASALFFFSFLAIWRTSSSYSLEERLKLGEA